MHVVLAQPADIPVWLNLAAEVESLFGPMVDDPAFHQALEGNIQRQTAFCIREQAHAPGTPLLGALLFSARHAPHYKISWLAVAQRWRRQGVAHALVEHCFQLIQPPAELSVVTSHRAGGQARHVIRDCIPAYKPGGREFRGGRRAPLPSQWERGRG